MDLERITFDPENDGRGALYQGNEDYSGDYRRAGGIGETFSEILHFYTYLESEDIKQALTYAL